MYRLGIDLGGTKIEGIVLDAKGNHVFRERILTEQEKGYDHILSNIKSVYTLLTEKIKGETHTLGMGTPGAISNRTGFLKNSNTVCFNGKLTKKALQDLLGRDFTISNDANCFALAEALHGAGKGYAAVFGVIMGTGCGGGIVLDNQVVEGYQSIGGEWGHMVIDPQGPLCYCGAKGCVETFISGSGIQKNYTSLSGQIKSVQDILEDYRNGDLQAQACIEFFLDRFGQAMANLINILDPEVIVLGGGVSNVDELYTQGYEKVREKIFSDSLETRIVKHQLGDSAGVIGAALIGI